jgi:serine/threonine protein kinase
LSLVMKLYEGGSLDKKIRDGTLDADKICRYTHALCRALRQLHGCGLLVRDIKPPNILFDSFDQPVLADFGIAEVVSTATRRLPTSIKGTFNYMAPETFLDAEAGGPGIGPPADIWAMACVVVEMHTRKVPWDGMNMQQIMRAVSLDYRAPAVPETAPAHALLARCFLRNPAHRPSAGDLADAFAPPSGARDMIAELCEEMDRLKAANTMLEARLKAAEAELAKERCERDTRERAREAELAEERCERDKEKARHAQVEQRIKVWSTEAAREGVEAAREGEGAAGQDSRRSFKSMRP